MGDKTSRGLTDDFKHGVSGGRFAFDLNGQDAEQQDLHGSASSIPASAATVFMLTSSKGDHPSGLS